MLSNESLDLQVDKNQEKMTGAVGWEETMLEFLGGGGKCFYHIYHRTAVCCSVIWLSIFARYGFHWSDSAFVANNNCGACWHYWYNNVLRLHLQRFLDAEQVRLPFIRCVFIEVKSLTTPESWIKRRLESDWQLECHQVLTTFCRSGNSTIASVIPVNLLYALRVVRVSGYPLSWPI